MFVMSDDDSAAFPMDAVAATTLVVNEVTTRISFYRFTWRSAARDRHRGYPTVKIGGSKREIN